MNSVWSYSAASDYDTDSRGNTMDVQERQNIVAGNSFIAKNNGYSWGELKSRDSLISGSFIDLSERSLGYRFSCRRSAGSLVNSLAPGDVLIVSSACRIAKDSRSFYAAVRFIRSLGVRLIVSRQGVDTGDPCWDMLESTSHQQRGAPTERRTNREAHQQRGKIDIYTRDRDSISVEDMSEMISFAEELKSSNESLRIGRIYAESSKSKRYIKQRPKGSDLNKGLSGGDHIVMWHTCSVYDSDICMLREVGDWIEAGVNLHFVSMSEEEENRVLQLSVIIREIDLAFKRVTKRGPKTRIVSRAKVDGKFASRPFWRTYRSNGEIKLVLDRSQILTFRLIRMLMRSGLSVVNSLIRTEEILAKRDSRSPIPMCGVLSVKSIWKLKGKYSMSQDGRIFPIWTFSRYKRGYQEYEQAKAAWASQNKAMKMRLKKLPQDSYSWAN